MKLYTFFRSSAAFRMRIALKVLQPGIAASAEFRRRFLDERQILA